MNRLKDTIAAIEPVSQEWREKAKQYILTLTMPPWALGRVLDTAVSLCGIQRTLHPVTARKRVMLFAGDHGIVEEGVSTSPQSVTVEMIRNFIHGGAAVNVLARQIGAEVSVIDAGVAGDLSAEIQYGKVINCNVMHGTNNFSKGPAMTREQAEQSILAGIKAAEMFSGSTDLFATGEMGIGNTTPSSAIIAVLTGQAENPDPLIGRGTWISDAALQKKKEIIRRGLTLNHPNPNDPLDILSKVGGCEIGAIAGLILSAAAHKKPVIVDGFISTAGALIAHALAPESAGYMIAAHGSAEPGHAAMLKHMGLTPLLDLGMRLGEGTGAVLAMPIVDSAAAILREMATFESAGVSC